MKTLPKKLKIYGREAYQIKREKNVAIYERGCKNYEVILIQYRKHHRKTPAGRIMSKGEYYPRASKWGLHGWTYITLDRAEEKFDKLIKESR